MEYMRLKINRNYSFAKKGQILKIPITKNGVPKDKFYRELIEDAKIDNCVEIVLGKRKSIAKNAAEVEPKNTK